MNRNFWIIALISLINSLSLTILIPVIYLYGQQFGLNDFQTSLLFATYSFAQFFATPVIGKLSDRFGRKPLLLISLLGTVIANLIAGTATVAWLLFFARFLDGITGGNASVVQAVISDVTTPENRARGFGINGAAFGMGLVLGPAVSLLAQQISLGAAFLVSGAIAFMALVITAVFLPETLEVKATEKHNLFDLGLNNLIKGITFPKVGILLIINFLLGTTFTMFTYAFQPYFIHVLNQTNRELTLVFLVFGALGVFMQIWGINWLTQKFNLVQILLLGLFVRGTAFLCMPLWQNVVYFIVVSTLFSLFNALVQPMISALLSLNSRPADQGTVLGLNASYLSASNAFGPVIAGLLINSEHPETYAYPLYVAGGLTLGILGLAIATQNRYQVKPRSSA
jgi:MFS family permease